jgi:hypothetical protein
VWLCAGLCGSVRVCAGLCGSVRVCAGLCGSVRICVALRGSVWLCVALRGSVGDCGGITDSNRTRIFMHLHMITWGRCAVAARILTQDSGTVPTPADPICFLAPLCFSATGPVSSPGCDPGGSPDPGRACGHCGPDARRHAVASRGPRCRVAAGDVGGSEMPTRVRECAQKPTALLCFPVPILFCSGPTRPGCNSIVPASRHLHFVFSQVFYVLDPACTAVPGAKRWGSLRCCGRPPQWLRHGDPGPHVH